MGQAPQWLAGVSGTPWRALATAMRAGLPVPNGFVALPSSAEEPIREAYEQLRYSEMTHFVAVRGASHAVLNILGADALIHMLRRFWATAPNTPVLVQRMVPAVWCGKAHWRRKNLRIRANEGMIILDPDTYLIDATNKCIRRTLEPKQRKLIRHVDGSNRVVEREGERTPIPAEHLAQIAGLAGKAASDIGWAIDDLDKVWLISLL